MSASTVMPSVQRMIDNHGVYITGSVDSTLTIIMVSIGGKICSVMLDQELAPDRFLDDFVIKSGPHQ